MALGNCKVAVALLLFLSCSSSFYGDAGDTITPSQPIKDPEAIVSAGNRFELGFFSPVNSTYRYVGIWYSNISAETQVLWVANRNKPINDSSGTMTISEDGNLVVLNGLGEVLWSSNVSIGFNQSTAQLTDDGNLVMKAGPNGNLVWQSFQQPTDTYLPKMRLSANARTGNKTLLMSWRSSSDPSVGNFSAGVNPFGIPELFIWYNGHPFWRSGPWVGQNFIGIPGMSTSVYLSGFTLQDEGDGTFTLSLIVDPAFRYSNVLTSHGKFTEQYWDSEKQGWEYTWEAPSTDCDIYGKCGSFGSCDAQSSPICTCLKGFVAKNPDEWNKGIWTSGCVRMTSLQCDRIQNGSEVGKEDGFMKLEMMKVPTFAEYRSYPSSEQECKDECLRNCSCVAYSYYNGFGCMAWTGNLIDIQKFSEGGTGLNIRLPYTELDNKRNMKVIISMSVIGGGIAICICVFLSWKWMGTHRERKLISEETLSFKTREAQGTVFYGNSPENVREVKLEPLFKLQILETATNNFDISKKLGQGGFGAVYWGKLPDGQEIAVKRLSKTSGQGLEEFMNEVVVISKLQHRNLVRLLGCCVEGEEMMLVYEYLPNKSLDAFLFDSLRKGQLHWERRFDIINGICRGLLYLHRDSRLRIIHRDLKPSNILLDRELNPKISDFGMARIFSGSEDQAWKLWNEGDITALVDPAISDPCFQVEIFRCIQIGLLCVQELAKDRPAVSTISSMLNSEIVDLPPPKKPAFVERQSSVDTEAITQSQKINSINNVTISDLNGR
ncbi:G-type lectin S-receptor-like serine/threonine-protein kinase [Populus alba x Populus x berolinensis]|uniref:Receptor-like serine/threonine-protein kinase n=1 Tax=Populus alba x Populus x berolinensis TaxID=444605 RepID=A0AAD6Q5S2_9ROSI|nr:G-type lectin S-receptor-like serine/threonine-protein kinase [Populus alba x Populus x berolinensis]